MNWLILLIEHIRFDTNGNDHNQKAKGQPNGKANGVGLHDHKSVQVMLHQHRNNRIGVLRRKMAVAKLGEVVGSVSE